MIHEDFIKALKEELADECYDSKDWKTSDLIGKIRWLKLQLEENDKQKFEKIEKEI